MGAKLGTRGASQDGPLGLAAVPCLEAEGGLLVWGENLGGAKL